jgi:carbon storage regulator
VLFRKDWWKVLVLSRKTGESIVINDNITITVTEIRGDKIRLGIVAPRSVPIHREEIQREIDGNKKVVEAPQDQDDERFVAGYFHRRQR